MGVLGIFLPSTGSNDGVTFHRCGNRDGKTVNAHTHCSVCMHSDTIWESGADLPPKAAKALSCLFRVIRQVR